MHLHMTSPSHHPHHIPPRSYHHTHVTYLSHPHDSLACIIMVHTILTVWSLIGQESVNTLTYLLCITPSCDSFYTGIQITTGLFHLWHSTDIYSTLHQNDVGNNTTTPINVHDLHHHHHQLTPNPLTYLTPTSNTNTYPPSPTPTYHLGIIQHHLVCTSISPSSTHFTHPHQHLYCVITSPHDRIEPLVNYTSTYTITYTLTLTTLHHLSLGLISLTPTSGLNTPIPTHHPQVYNTIHLDFLQHTSTSWHTQLSTYLTTLGSSSIASTHHLLLSSHPHLSSTYPTHLSIFCHHQWIGSLLTLESSAHTSIQSLQHPITTHTIILQHHHTIITHLTWLNISLSSHTLTPYLHKDVQKISSMIILHTSIHVYHSHHPQSYLTHQDLQIDLR